MDISQLLTLTKEKQASDLHLSIGVPPTLRIHGDMAPLPFPSLDAATTHDLIYSIFADEHKSLFEKKHEIDLAIQVAGVGRFRVNAFRQRQGDSAVFRLVPSEIKDLEVLGLPTSLGPLVMKDRGLILVTGNTGSGKSTTLAAMVNRINSLKKGHIITIEDPIEFVHQHKSCIVSQREVGVHTESFASALRNALREDPNVILVGELRDLETIQMAITAAETGHLVLATVHTNDCSSTVDRIVDVFPAHQQKQIRMQFANAIEGVISQRLLKRKDGKGRVCAAEVMMGTPAIASLIREGKTHQIYSMIQTGQKDGMRTMDQALQELYSAGLISEDVVRHHAVSLSSIQLLPGEVSGSAFKKYQS